MKYLKIALITALVAALSFTIYYLWQALPVVSAYGAKNLCSCVFLTGRAPSDVIEKELNFSFIKYGSFEINREDSSATGAVFGLATRRAIYRNGLGCTLVVGTTKEEMLDQPFREITMRAATDSTELLKTEKNEQLKQVLARAFSGHYGEGTETRGVVVIRGGEIAGEKYQEPFKSHTPQLGWSMTKSITNALIGIMVKKGAIDIHDNAPIAFWQEDERAEITYDDLLRMSSGLEWEEQYGGVSTATTMLFKTYNAGFYAAQQPLAHEPGTHWYYSSGTTNILSMLIRQKMDQQEYFAFPYKELFDKLGMSSALIEPDPSGVYIGSSFMYASPRDWAKFALLYLNDGIWNGERVLPEGWVKYTTSVTANSGGRYGAQFWLNDNYSSFKDLPEDTYYMNGFQGQSVLIIPSHDLVVARLAFDPKENFDMNTFARDIMEVMR